MARTAARARRRITSSRSDTASARCASCRPARPLAARVFDLPEHRLRGPGERDVLGRAALDVFCDVREPWAQRPGTAETALSSRGLPVHSSTLLSGPGPEEFHYLYLAAVVMAMNRRATAKRQRRVRVVAADAPSESSHFRSYGAMTPATSCPIDCHRFHGLIPFQSQYHPVTEGT